MEMHMLRILPGLVAILAAAGCDSGGLAGSKAMAAPAAEQGAAVMQHIDDPIGPSPGTPEPGPTARNPHTGSAQAAKTGRDLYVAMNCVGCHGGRAGGGIGPSLRDDTWIYGGEPVDIYDSIAEGRAYGMPAWGQRLPPDAIWKLTTYITSLRTDLEPDAP
jgi:cytochrome c oxidase cbb3-type subunit 3